MKRRVIGQQGTLFGDPEATNIEIRPRAVAAPYGAPDKKGRYWYQRLTEEIEELPEGARDAVLVMLLVWPADRTEAARKILGKWARAEHLERDNFAEGLGF